eukprot:4386393-Pleurochrysis_carterae.AAC.1
MLSYHSTSCANAYSVAGTVLDRATSRDLIALDRLQNALRSSAPDCILKLPSRKLWVAKRSNCSLSGRVCCGARPHPGGARAQRNRGRARDHVAAASPWRPAML